MKYFIVTWLYVLIFSVFDLKASDGWLLLHTVLGVMTIHDCYKFMLKD